MMNGMMTQFARIEPGKTVEEAHMRNRKLIAEWCYERGKDERVVEKVVKDGKTYIVVNDYQKLRGLFGELLKEIQRIKSTGDFESGRELVETYAVQIDPELHKEVLDRYQKLGLAPYSGFVNPVYQPVMENGEIGRRQCRIYRRLCRSDDGVFARIFVPAFGKLTGNANRLRYEKSYLALRPGLVYRAA